MHGRYRNAYKYPSIYIYICRHGLLTEYFNILGICSVCFLSNNKSRRIILTSCLCRTGIRPCLTKFSIKTGGIGKEQLARLCSSKYHCSVKNMPTNTSEIDTLTDCTPFFNIHSKRNVKTAVCGFRGWRVGDTFWQTRAVYSDYVRQP